MDKLSKDLFIIQKDLVKAELESYLLDKKKERLLLDENNIKLRQNQIQFKIDEQNKKNLKNKDENELQVEYYETMIRQKSFFFQFTDDKHERQKQMEQEAKVDSNDKQEIDRRRKLLLLILYNQYLRERMAKQLKRYEKIELTFEQIRNILGTQDLSSIINFILERNKRFNFNLNIVEEKQKKIKNLKNDIKKLKTKLISLKNKLITDEDSKEETKLETPKKDYNGLDEDDIEMIKIENETNQKLNLLGKKYNKVSLAYSQVLTNIKTMQEYDKIHPMDLGNYEEEKDEKEEIKDEVKKWKNLTQEEETNIQGYENLLKKILKVFNILYLCKTKQEFINLMKEKGINQYDMNDNKRANKKHRTKRNTKRSIIKINSKTLNKKTTDEEEDLSNYDHDKNILNRFIKEQKKETEDFIFAKNSD
jgi:hypothetical protein